MENKCMQRNSSSLAFQAKATFPYSLCVPVDPISFSSW